MADSKLPSQPGAGPAAYLITFACYGTRLHGDEKGSVDRFHNLPHTPLASADSNRVCFEQRLMKTSPVSLSAAERQQVLDSIRQQARHRGWLLHAAHVRSTHVHVVVGAEAAPEKVMTQVKIYASRALSRSAGARPRRWAHHGSTRYLWDSEQVAAAVNYVVQQQGRPMALYVNPQPPAEPRT